MPINRIGTRMDEMAALYLGGTAFSFCFYFLSPTIPTRCDVVYRADWLARARLIGGVKYLGEPILRRRYRRAL